MSGTKGVSLAKLVRQRDGGTLWRWVWQVGGLVVALAFACFFWRDFCFWRAEAQLLKRNPAVAADWIARSQWLRTQPDAQSCLLQIQAARRLGNFRDVESLLKQAASLGVPQAAIERERLLAMAQTNQFVAMQSRWDKLLADPRNDGPEIARAYYAWCMLNHRLVQAERTLILWSEDYPQDSEPLALLGRYYQSLLKWDGAEAAYRKSLTLSPADDSHRLSLANVLRIRLKHDEAIPLFKDYLKRHPQDINASRGLAQCFANRGDLSTAVQIMREVYSTHPEDFETQRAYGELLLSSGDATEAVAVLEKAHRAVPEYAKLSYDYARALKASGRKAEAAPLFEFVAQSQPELDRLNELEERLRIQPDNLKLRMQIAETTAKYVSRREGIRWYEAVLQIAPNYRPAHRALADLYQSLGDSKLAAAHTTLAADAPSFTNRSEASPAAPRLMSTPD